MIHKITEKIFIGDSDDAWNIDNLHEAGISAVLNVAKDLDVGADHYYRSIEAHKVGLVDGPGNLLVDYYAAIIKLHSLLQRHDKVLVHCHAGVSRSPSIVAMYMIATNPADYPDFWHAVNEIANRRPCVSPGGAMGRDCKQIDFVLLRKLLCLK